MIRYLLTIFIELAVVAQAKIPGFLPITFNSSFLLHSTPVLVVKSMVQTYLPKADNLN